MDFGIGRKEVWEGVVGRFRRLEGEGGDARAVLYRHFCGGFFYGMAVLTGFLGYGFVWGSSGTSL